MAVQYTNVKKFIKDIEDFEITSVLEEDMSTYDTPLPQQYYLMIDEKMVANWCALGTGSIIGPRANSQWSTKYRKFKTLSFKQFKEKFGVK